MSIFAPTFRLRNPTASSPVSSASMSGAASVSASGTVTSGQFRQVSLILPKAWLHAPGLYYDTLQYTNPLDVEINWAHPLAKDLAAYFFPGNPYDLVTGKPLAIVGTENRIHANVAGLKAFLLSDYDSNSRIESDITDDPYFTSTNFSANGLSMAAHYWIRDGLSNHNVIALNRNSRYDNWHLVAAASNSGDPFYGQFVINFSFTYQTTIVNNNPYYVGTSRWNYCGGSLKQSNYLRTWSNERSALDSSGTITTSTYDNIALGARQFGSTTTSYTNPMDGAVAWGGCWKRTLTDHEHLQLKTNPYQILKVKS